MSRGRLWLGIVVGVALALRLGAAVFVQRIVDADANRAFLVPGDANGYWDLAGDLVAGDPYAVHDPPRFALRMPGFPLLLAATRAISGGSPFFARLVLAGVGAATCLLVYRLGRVLRDERTGLVAAGGAALSPLLVGFSPLVLSETAFAATLVGAMLAFARMRQRVADAERGLRSAFLVGLVVGLGVYVRPSWILASPLLAVAEVAFGRASRPATARAVLIVAGTALTLVPWTIRNARATGHFVPLTLWAGPSLYDGLNPDADGSSDMAFFERDRERGVTAGMTEYEIDRHYRREALRFAWRNPLRTLELAGVKLARYFSPWPNAEGFRQWWIAVPATVAFAVLFGFAAVGAWRNRGDALLLAATLGPLLYFAALHAVFVGSLRYRLPAEYALWVLAACGVPRRTRFGGEP